jgi:hypothetical protein
MGRTLGRKRQSADGSVADHKKTCALRLKSSVVRKYQLYYIGMSHQHDVLAHRGILSNLLYNGNCPALYLSKTLNALWRLIGPLYKSLPERISSVEIIQFLTRPCPYVGIHQAGIKPYR